MRVLTPKGVVMVGGKKTVKPWPKEIDTWPQYLNKADNNAVAMDSVVGPPRRIQWMDTPIWSRSHMGISTIASVVTCNGRLFSIEDRSLPDNPFLPGRFMFVARDAFNGRTLWTREIEQWESITVYIKCLPTQQQRRMVATDDILYCTPVLEGPLAALDAATGKTLKTYEGISPVQEVAYDQGILFVNVGDRFNAAAYNQTDKKSSGPEGTAAEPFNGSGFRKGYAPEIQDKPVSSSVIVAIDPETGPATVEDRRPEELHGCLVGGQRRPCGLPDGRRDVLHPPQDRERTVEREESDHKHQRTRFPHARHHAEHGDHHGRQGVRGRRKRAVRLLPRRRDGRCGTSHRNQLPGLAGRVLRERIVWIGGKNQPTAHDPETGEIIKTLDQAATGPMGHDRCYRNLITQKYFINSKTGGADFLDLATDGEFPNHWTRGSCGMGVLPANGLLYSTPYSCTCNVGDMFQGMNAYSADPALLESNDAGIIHRETTTGKRTGIRLRADPASSLKRILILIDWPTYRGNAFRGGMTASTVSAQLKVKWQAKLPTSPTASTIADGKVFVCDSDTHTLYALDSTSGETAWTFTADGRIDSPPTYHKAWSCSGHVTAGSIASGRRTGNWPGVSKTFPTD